MLGYSKNYVALALNCMLKNSKKIIYQYQKLKEKIKTII